LRDSFGVLFQDKKRFKLNIKLYDFLGSIKCFIIVCKELFDNVSRICLYDDDYDEIPLLIFYMAVIIDINSDGSRNGPPGGAK